MTVNLKKIAKDIFHDDEDVRMLALTAVLQLSSTSIAADGEGLAVLRDSLGKAVKQGDDDMVFLARKGLNHLDRILSVGAVRPGPADGVSDGSRQSAPAGPAGGGSAGDAGAGTASLGPGAASRSELLAVIASPKSDMQLASAVSALVREGESRDVDRILPLLAHSDARVRSNAVEFLERHADPETLVEKCLPLLDDENNRVVGTVATVLGRLGHEAVIERLSSLLRDAKVSIRESAVYALSNIKGPGVVRLLLQALDDPYEGIRARALKGLARHKDPSTIPGIRRLLDDVDPAVCEEAERALAFISMEEAEGFGKGRMDIAAGSHEVPSVPPCGGADGDELPGDGRKGAGLPAPPAGGASPPAEILRLGRLLFERHQASSLPGEGLDGICYSIVKTVSFLQRHRERLAALTGGEGGLLEGLRPDLGDPVLAERKAVAELERRLELDYAGLAERAMALIESGDIEFSDDPALVEAVEAVKGRTAG